MQISLKKMKEFFFSSNQSPPLFDLEVQTTLQFFQTFIPKQLLDDPSFKTALQSSSILSRIYTGTHISAKLESAVISFFSSNPQNWTELIELYRHNIEHTCSDKSKLRSYLVKTVFAEVKQHLRAEHVSAVHRACAHDLPRALAIAIIYALVQGNISFIFEQADASVDAGYRATSCLSFIKRSLQEAFADKNQFDALYANYSDLFSRLASVVKSECEILEDFYFLDNLLYAVVTCCKGSHALKIIGPTGSEKNTITQLLFLKLSSRLSSEYHNFLPLYISIHQIKMAIDDQPNFFDDYYVPFINSFIKVCENNTTLIPIVFIDDLVEYDWGVEGTGIHSPIDFQIESILQKKSLRNRLKYVVSIDQGFSENNSRIRAHIPFISNYCTIIKTKPFSLENTDAALTILDLYDKVYGLKAPDSKNLYDTLKTHKFNALDLYQVRFLDQAFYEQSHRKPIAEIFQAECERRLKITTIELLQTAEYAYELAYGHNSIEENHLVRNVRNLMYHHRSFIEYLIAYHYLHCLAETRKLRNIHNVVLPKGITFFIVNILRARPDIENNVINFCREHYSDLSLHGKSQIAYLLGRIQSYSFMQPAKDMLHQLFHKEQQQYHAQQSHISQEQLRQQLFLIRSISVSLIYMGESDISDSYICQLISDPVSNDINRGFHLEYYGDIEYNPSLLILHYRDNVTVGSRTISQLLDFLSAHIHSALLPLSFELNLFSLCSILQARIASNSMNKLNVHAAVAKTTNLLQQYMALKCCQSTKVKSYFSFCIEEFTHYLDSPVNNQDEISTRQFNKISKAHMVNRKGWEKRGIPNPENIVEHSYCAWQIGWLYLPNNYSEPLYNKQDILNMLLIHDLGEVFVGDATPDENNAQHRNDEDNAMRHFLLAGTYPTVESLDKYYELWDEWQQMSSINAKIAKDIDEIQCCYQVCLYQQKYSTVLSADEALKWIRGYRLRTTIGKDILNRAVIQNYKFKSLFSNCEQLNATAVNSIRGKDSVSTG